VNKVFCHHCGEEIKRTECESYTITYNGKEVNLIASVLGRLDFHLHCFMEVAGREYADCLYEKHQERILKKEKVTYPKVEASGVLGPPLIADRFSARSIADILSEGSGVLSDDLKITPDGDLYFDNNGD